MTQTKHSRQRDAIYQFLISRTDHPTAEFIYSNVQKEFPNISLGTVYRNLAFLTEQGKAIRVPCDDGSVHFDGNVMPHYHFQCLKCKRILDLNLDSKQLDQKINESASKGFMGEILGNITFFYGYCPDCKED